MKELRSEVTHPAKQLGYTGEQALRPVQLENPLGKGSKHTLKRLDPPFVVNLVVVRHKALPNVMNGGRKRTGVPFAPERYKPLYCF